LLGGRSHTIAPAGEQRLSFTDIERFKRLRDEGTALTASSAHSERGRDACETFGQIPAKATFPNEIGRCRDRGKCHAHRAESYPPLRKYHSQNHQLLVRVD
jgi:hypothetical protein